MAVFGAGSVERVLLNPKQIRRVLVTLVTSLLADDVALGGKFAANGATAQAKLVIGAKVVTTAAALTAYGFAEAQANALVTKVNTIHDLLVAYGLGKVS